MTVTLDQLLQIYSHCPKLRAANLLPYLNKACLEFGITTPLRLAAFLAQLGHESGELRYMAELASGEAYEGRKDLGNTEPGDGKRYKGRGPIQLTGRKNYRAAGAALGLDLEGDPERAKDPDVAFRAAGWFWKTHGLNELADQQNFDAITRRINGAYNGKPQRDAYYEKAKSVLQVWLNVG